MNEAVNKYESRGMKIKATRWEVQLESEIVLEIREEGPLGRFCVHQTRDLTQREYAAIDSQVQCFLKHGHFDDGSDPTLLYPGKEVKTVRGDTMRILAMDAMRPGLDRRPVLAMQPEDGSLYHYSLDGKLSPEVPGRGSFDLDLEKEIRPWRTPDEVPIDSTIVSPNGNRRRITSTLIHPGKEPLALYVVVDFLGNPELWRATQLITWTIESTGAKCGVEE